MAMGQSLICPLCVILLAFYENARAMDVGKVEHRGRSVGEHYGKRSRESACSMVYKL